MHYRPNQSLQSGEHIVLGRCEAERKQHPPMTPCLPSKGLYGLLRNVLTHAQRLASNFLDLLELTRNPDIGTRSFSRPELAGSRRGEADLRVTARPRIAACACGEYGCLALGERRLGHGED